MTKYTNRIQWTAIFALISVLTLAAFSACKKKDSGDGPQSPASTALIMGVSQTEPYSYVEFTLPAGSSPKEIKAGVIEVNLGAVKIQASRKSTPQSNTYVYQMFIPEITPGTQTVSITLSNDVKSEGVLTILAPVPMNDPNAYLTQFRNEVGAELDELATIYDAMVTAGKLRQSAADSLKVVIQNSKDDIATHANGLSAEELALYARMLRSNLYWITDYYSSLKQFPFTTGMSLNGTDPCQTYKDAYQIALLYNRSDDANQAVVDHRQCVGNSSVQKLEASSGYMARLESAYEDAKLEYQTTPGFKKASSAFLKTFFSASWNGLTEQFKANNNLSDVNFGVESIEDAAKRNKIVFINNEATSFSAGVILSNLNRQSSVAGFEGLLVKIDYLNSMLGKFSAFLPGIQELSVKPRVTEKMYVSLYSIDQISDSRITASTKSGGTGRMVTFSSNAGQSFDFTFRLTVTTKFGTASKVIQARLSDPGITGTWDIEKTYFSDDNTPGSFEPGDGAYMVIDGTTLTWHEPADTTVVTYPYTYNKTNKTLTFDGSVYQMSVFTETDLILRDVGSNYLFEIYMKRRP